MSFNVLLAASPSFCDEDLFVHKLNHLLQNKPAREFHVLTQKIFTKMCTSYGKCTVYARDFFNDGAQTTMILYNQILQQVDAVVVFWDGETSNEKRLIEECLSAEKKHVIIRYESFKQEMKRMIAEEKKQPKRKKITVQLTKGQKQRYFDAHKMWFEREYPTAFKDGHYARPKVLPINSGSRMDTFIVNFIVWSGWSATTVRATGRQVNGKWIPGTTKKGTFDLTATIKSRSVKIETKHSSDKPSQEQLKMQVRERNAGAIAEFVYSIDEFFVLYDKIINCNFV